MGRLLKYMGISHDHTLLAGDDFGGRLSTPLPQTVVFDRSNSWVVDADEAGLSDEAVAVLLSDEWADVSGLALIPLNRNQTTFLGMTEPGPLNPSDEAAEIDAAALAEEQRQAAEAQAQVDAAAQAQAEAEAQAARDKKKNPT